MQKARLVKVGGAGPVVTAPRLRTEEKGDKLSFVTALAADVRKVVKRRPESQTKARIEAKRILGIG